MDELVNGDHDVAGLVGFVFVHVHCLELFED